MCFVFALHYAKISYQKTIARIIIVVNGETRHMSSEYGTKRRFDIWRAHINKSIKLNRINCLKFSVKLRSMLFRILRYEYEIWGLVSPDPYNPQSSHVV